MKRLFIISALAVAATAAQAQTRYQISGSVPEGISKVYVVDYMKRLQRIDSAAVKGGTFALEGMADDNALLAVANDREQAVHIFFNDGCPIVADLAHGTLRGSAQNSRLNDYDRRLDSLNEVSQQLMEEYQRINAMTDASDEEKGAALAPLMQKLQAFSLEEMGTYAAIMGEKDNFIPVPFLEDLVMLCQQTGNTEEASALVSPDRPYYSHPLAQQAIQRIEAMARKMKIVGQPFIDLEEADMDGHPHRLSDYCGKGNYVLIDFWASWCGPCMAEMPNVKANYDKYRAKGFQVVGLSFDQKAEAWKKAVRDKDLNWIHLSDLKGWRTIAASTYDINSIPSSLLVGPDGIIVARDLRGEALGKKLQEIYGF